MSICIGGPNQLSNEILEAVIDHYKHAKKSKIGTLKLSNSNHILSVCIYTCFVDNEYLYIIVTMQLEFCPNCILFRCTCGQAGPCNHHSAIVLQCCMSLL